MSCQWHHYCGSHGFLVRFISGFVTGFGRVLIVVLPTHPIHTTLNRSREYFLFFLSVCLVVYRKVLQIDFVYCQFAQNVYHFWEFSGIIF